MKRTYYLTVDDGSKFVNGSRRYTSKREAARAAHQIAELLGCEVYVCQYLDGFGGEVVDYITPTPEA